MSNLPEESPVWRDFNQRTQERRTGELKKIQADAEQVSALLADPRWEFYGRYIEVRKKAADLLGKSYQDRMLRDFMPRDEYAALHVKMAEQRGISAGLDFALTIAKVLIEQGEVAVEELKLLTKNE